MPTMKASFTSGPWHISGGQIVSGATEICSLEMVFNANGAEDHSRWNGNARLIAAAPELLEALKIATIWAPHNHDPNQDSNGHCPKCNADAAIAKAEGKET